jgi:hypothetical protein
MSRQDIIFSREGLLFRLKRRWDSHSSIYLYFNIYLYKYKYMLYLIRRVDAQ